MQQVFTKDYELTYRHIDWRGTAHPAAYFDFMQDAATLHARIAHLDGNDLPILWVLSRMHVMMDRALAPYDTVTLETWCAGVKGARFVRAFSFSSGGQPVGRAISCWVILDPKTHRVLRPNTVPAAAAYACVERDVLPMPDKLDVSGLTLHHTHAVTYSDLDINRHLNNVQIASLVADALDLGERDRIRSLQINYTAETPAGVTLALYAARDAHTFRVRGEAEGKVRFAAAGTFGCLDW